LRRAVLEIVRPSIVPPVLGNEGDKMVEILKFIRPGEAAFDPEAIGVLA
jgi:hypothetical protein